ncbi:MAG: DUF4838 domain-containing protein [Ruminococcaceae bacterium]|nr:DUF4838 domain-containing protein [Oscillospiraceae bacterium]
MKHFLSLVLIATLLLSCLLTGCKTDDPIEETSPETTTPETTTPEEEKPDFPPEGAITLTAATISGGETPAELTALNDLKNYLEQKGVDFRSDSGFPITVSIDESLGDDAFRVTAVVGEGKEQGLSIVGGNGRGILYGVYQFLEKHADVRFFTPELEVCNPGDVYIWDGVLLDYTPTFELRHTDWYNWMDDTQKHAWAAKTGINLMSGWKRSWSEDFGGSFTYAPDLFVHTISFLLKDPTIKNPRTADNPCLTDETIYNTVLSNVRKSLETDPTAKIVSISQNDNKNYCECENCAAITAEEGSPSGTLLRFVNRIAADLAPDYPDLTIDTLAYQDTLPAPKITKPAPNVCVRLCTIECHFNHPLTEVSCGSCSKFRRAIKDWGAICDNLYIWDYTTNYAYYLATFPNFHVLRSNMQFFAKNNVKGVYEQGNASGPSGEFGELRTYLISKLLMNPSMTSKEYYTHMDEFLAAYYGEGWQNIREYIDAFTQYAKTYPSEKGGMGIYSYPFTFFPEAEADLESIEERLNEYWDAAEAAAGDRLEYVQRSRWQLRYLSLFVHPDLETATQFAAEVEAAGTKWSERNAKLPEYAYEQKLLALKPSEWFTKKK